MLVIAIMATAALDTILTITVDLPDWICDGELYRVRFAASSRRNALWLATRAVSDHRLAAIDEALDPTPATECLRMTVVLPPKLRDDESL
jgi:hypothetical protein